VREAREQLGIGGEVGECVRLVAGGRREDRDEDARLVVPPLRGVAPAGGEIAAHTVGAILLPDDIVVDGEGREVE